jgi:hypothetical protein
MTSPVFAPTGVSYKIAYADDSTDASLSVPAAQAVSVFNADTANVVVVNFGFNSDGDTDAVVPVSGTPGKGSVIGPNQQLTFSLPQAGYTTPMYISVAGVSGTGNVFISTGSFQ